MTHLNALVDRAAGAAFGLTNYGNLEADINYLAIAGADIAAVTGGNTLPITNEFHRVTAATGNVDNITDVLGLASGQPLRLLFTNAQTLRNNGGGAGNIRTLSGADRAVRANEIVLLAYDATGAVWREQASGPLSYRKTTAKTVANSVTETDLLNGEITVAANAIGASGVLRLTAWGDWKQNSGGTAAMPRFKLKLGATTLLDTNTGAATTLANDATRYGWRIACEIANLGATNSQWATIDGRLAANVGTNTSPLFATGEGVYLASSTILSALGGNAGAVDTTASQALVLSVILGAANANYDIVLKDALVEVGV